MRMSKQERLSRRQFLGLAGAGSMGAAIIIGKRLAKYSLNMPPNLSETDFISEQTLEDLLRIDTSKSQVFFEAEVNGERSLIKSTINLSAFAKAIYTISANESPENGKAMTFSFLTNHPLEIRLEDKPPKERPKKDGQNYLPTGNYTPLLWGGPSIISYKKQLIEYYLLKRDNNYSQLVEKDFSVWHEIIHFWQDVRNPYKQFIGSSMLGLNEFLAQHGLNPQFEKANDPIEAEADKIAKQYAVASFVDKTMADLDEPHGNLDTIFGEFYSFSVIDNKN